MAALYKNARLVIVAMGDVVVTEEEQKVLRQFIAALESYGEVTTQLPFVKMNPPFILQNMVLRGFWNKFLGSRVCLFLAYC
jgi:hypothetical protein